VSVFLHRIALEITFRPSELLVSGEVSGLEIHDSNAPPDSPGRKLLQLAKLEAAEGGSAEQPPFVRFTLHDRKKSDAVLEVSCALAILSTD
jgi:hypothetical protein